MIEMTRLNGHVAWTNPDLIQTLDATPDTVVTLVDGQKFLVSESVSEIIDRIIAFRAAVLRAAQHPAPVNPSRTANVVSLARKERTD